jgi:cbb3-type cytochrome oxidase maturation protein
MSYLSWLVPIALGMGVLGLLAFLWSMRSGQYEDLDGAAERVLLADAVDSPLRQNGTLKAANVQAAQDVLPKGEEQK